jgi:hypothetical protein
MAKPDFEQDELYILVECIRDDAYMRTHLYLDDANDCGKVLLDMCEEIDEYPQTIVWFFHDDIRETKLVFLDEPYDFLNEVKGLLGEGWYPVYTELTVNADGKDDWRFLAMRFFSADPSVEDQAIFNGTFPDPLQDALLEA